MTRSAKQPVKPRAKAASQVASQITGQVASQTSGQKSDLDALTNRVAALENSVKALSENAAHPAEGANDQAARLTIAAERCAPRSSAARREAELAAVQSLGVTQDATAPLQSFAANGVPTPAALAQELAALTPDMRRASEPSSADRHFSSAWKPTLSISSASRRSMCRPAMSPQAVMARIEADAGHADTRRR